MADLKWKKETIQETILVRTRPTWTTTVGLYKVKIEEDLEPYGLPVFQVEVSIVRHGPCFNSFDARWLRARTLEEAQFLGARVAEILTEAQELINAASGRSPS